jgi:hypothetical protein
LGVGDAVAVAKGVGVGVALRYGLTVRLAGAYTSAATSLLGEPGPSAPSVISMSSATATTAQAMPVPMAAAVRAPRDCKFLRHSGRSTSHSAAAMN